jgi:peptidoglycan/LPS O-acetylase OafA/YrhL
VRDTDAPDRRVGSVEGLRAVAALSVFAFHLTWRAPVLRHSPVASWTGHFDTGVEIFFVLSGFLIFTPFAKALVDRRPLPRTLPYVARRAVRIWPGFLVALSVVILTGLGDVDGWTGFTKHASLTYLYFEDRGGRPLSVAWTLVVELSFYALVPVLAWCMAQLRLRHVERCGLLVLVGAYFQHLVAYDLHTRPFVRVLPPALLALGLGMLLAVVRAQGAGGGRLSRWLRALGARPAVPLLAAALACVVLVVAVPAGTDIVSRPADRFAKELLQAVIAGGITLPVLLGSGTSGWWRRLLSHPVLTYVGTISFGLYLWHLPVLRQFRPLLVSEHPVVAVAGWCLALGITLAVAAASWHLVERPAMDAVRRRLADRRAVVGSPRG